MLFAQVIGLFDQTNNCLSGNTYSGDAIGCISPPPLIAIIVYLSLPSLIVFTIFYFITSIIVFLVSKMKKQKKK